MTTVARADEELEDDQTFTLDGVSWETYESLLNDLDNSGQHKRVIYDRGRMAILSPLPKHEKWKSLLGCFVEAIAEGREVPISTYGQTTWKRRDLQRGLEPDECFYIQHEPQMRGKLEIDLMYDPPPDLCIEVDLRRGDIDKPGVYGALGIGEVWHLRNGEIEVLVLEKAGTYRRSDFSAAFPFLRLAELKQFLDQFGQRDQTSLVRLVREWAKTLAK
jgi:Uma2 family endonuclease